MIKFNILWVIVCICAATCACGAVLEIVLGSGRYWTTFCGQLRSVCNVYRTSKFWIFSLLIRKIFFHHPCKLHTLFRIFGHQFSTITTSFEPWWELDTKNTRLLHTTIYHYEMVYPTLHKTLIRYTHRLHFFGNTVLEVAERNMWVWKSNILNFIVNCITFMST